MGKSPSLRRIQADIRELALDPSDRYHAAPMENDMFEWHFTIRGADDTDFAGGIYHGRILLPPEYPFKPPHIIFLTPSGRFETHTKVCLSFSAYHPELWQPAWGIRLILEALISFLPTPADGAIGALDWTCKERQNLAKKSITFCCPTCGPIKNLLPELKPKKEGEEEATKKPAASLRFAKEIQELQRLQELTEGAKAKKTRGVDEDNEEKIDEKDDDDKPTASTAAAETKTAPSPTPSSNTNDAASSRATAAAAALPSTTASATTASQPTAPTESSKSTPAPSAPQHSEEKAAAQPMVHPPPSAPQEAPANQEQHQHQQNGEQGANQIDTTALDQSVNDDIEDMNQTLADPAWMMDPLLHLMIGLLAVICYMLLQKWNALYAELLHLRALNQQHL
mmetsp:Transcript_27695/g.77583  ORF Transcript_27695/g.77583 Transcript_27695/m.77583 type:complete len:396 (-) Transcript_27695:203-1390(-)